MNSGDGFMAGEGGFGKTAWQRPVRLRLDEISYIRFHKNQSAALRVNVIAPTLQRGPGATVAAIGQREVERRTSAG